MPKNRGHGGDPPDQEEELYCLVQSELEPAVSAVAHLEHKWSEAEMIKRLRGYIIRAASESSLPSLSWSEAVETFVSMAMSSFVNSCEEREWFFEINLAPVFARVIYTVLSWRSKRKAESWQKISTLAEDQYQNWIDVTLQQKALWMAASETFSRYEHPIHKKIYDSLDKTYKAALANALAARASDDLQRVEIFMQEWMEAALSRAWSALDSVDGALSEELAVKLFKRLVAPFGADNPYSVVPGVLTEHIGRPPPNWAFIAQQVRSIFRRWRMEASGAAKKRRRDRGPGGGVGGVAVFDAFDRAPPEEAEPDGEGMAEADADGAEEGEEEPLGHPQCTSEEDCQGRPSDPLIRHLLEDQQEGDVYCSSCWESFKSQNPKLEGKPVEPDTL